MPLFDSPKKKRPHHDLGAAVELCSGMGGIGIGLRALGFHIAKAYDSWTEAVAVYNHNFSGEIAATCNLLSEKGRDLVKADCRRLGQIDLLAAGPPCKGFSQLRNGHHDGRNGHNRVLAAMPDYIALLKPRLFLIENVPDLIRHRDGRTFAGILGRLERPTKRLRYRVEYKVYDAALFGTPQARRRILILGVQHASGTERLADGVARLPRCARTARGRVLIIDYSPSPHRSAFCENHFPDGAFFRNRILLVGTSPESPADQAHPDQTVWHRKPPETVGRISAPTFYFLMRSRPGKAASLA